MSLRIPEGAAYGIGATAEKGIRARWDVADAVEHRITKELGIQYAKEPAFPCPDLSFEQLSTPSGDEYTKVYYELVSWQSYVIEQRTRVKSRLHCVEAEIEDLSVSLRNTLRKLSKAGPNKLTTAEIDDAVSSDERYIEVNRERIYLKALVTQLDDIITARDQKIKLVSRQIEIRKLELEHLNNGGGRMAGPRPALRTPREGR